MKKEIQWERRKGQYKGIHRLAGYGFVKVGLTAYSREMSSKCLYIRFFLFKQSGGRKEKECIHGFLSPISKVFPIVCQLGYSQPFCSSSPRELPGKLNSDTTEVSMQQARIYEVIHGRSLPGHLQFKSQWTPKGPARAPAQALSQFSRATRKPIVCVLRCERHGAMTSCLHSASSQFQNILQCVTGKSASRQKRIQNSRKTRGLLKRKISLLFPGINYSFPEYLKAVLGVTLESPDWVWSNKFMGTFTN